VAGSHLAISISPDAEYVITGMQENSLHGWRMPEKTDLRMDGYPSKTRSFSWDKRGRWLATSGANAAIVWPFVGKLGPQGKPPLQPGEREALVTAVAFHPSDEVLAIGYADGAAIVVRFADSMGMELDEPGEGAVSALAWSADGKRIAIGDEAGRGAIIDVFQSARVSHASQNAISAMPMASTRRALTACNVGGDQLGPRAPRPARSACTRMLTSKMR
jgi:WD40 repeat protein